ncbi:MAG: 4-hydroxy-3-methylbut-2-enyl diphosphate reductase, partial [Eggerthellaceae bacterium]|nr:4-hydroxy-3-methylbut-2-enyl diphosphate reductase [Eggerthellaceae bacterium]
MKVLQAKHAGACYGVQRALDMAQQAAFSGATAYTLGPLIHNPQVVSDLEAQGVRVATEVASVEEGATVIIRSHGVTPQVRAAVEERGLPLVDATCPHVARAQAAAAQMAEEGCRVIIVGEEGHPEVEGIKACARQLGAKVDVVGGPHAVPQDLRDPIGVVAQTTQMRDNFEAVVAAVQEQGIVPRVKNTIC